MINEILIKLHNTDIKSLYKKYLWDILKLKGENEPFRFRDILLILELNSEWYKSVKKAQYIFLNMSIDPKPLLIPKTDDFFIKGEFS